MFHIMNSLNLYVVFFLNIDIVVIRNIILALSSPLKHWPCMRESCGGREQAHVDAGLWWGIVVRRLNFYDLNFEMNVLQTVS